MHFNGKIENGTKLDKFYHKIERINKNFEFSHQTMRLLKPSLLSTTEEFYFQLNWSATCVSGNK